MATEAQRNARRNEKGQYVKGVTGNPHGPAPKVIDSHTLPSLTKLAARGVREQDLARYVGMSNPTWAAYKATHPEVEEAIAAGRQVMHDSLVNTLYAKAMKGDIVALLFMLKARFGWREGDEPGEMRPQITINLPGALSMDNYRPPIEYDARPALTAEIQRG